MATDEQRLMVRLEATATKLVKELQRAESETRRRMKGIDDAVTSQNRKLVEGLGRSASSLQRGASESKNFGFAVQNAAFQVGDFATQVASGTDASRALAQQLPQLLGGLGMFGAIAGAAAAIVLPLASNWLFAADTAEKAADRIEALGTAMTALRSATAAASISSQELGEKFGGQADAAREILQIQRQVAEIQAQSAFAAASQGAASAIFGDEATYVTLSNIEKVADAYDAAMVLVEQQGMSARAAFYEIATTMMNGVEDGAYALFSYNDAINSVVETYGISVTAARELLQATMDMQAADNTAARADAAKRLAEMIFEATNGMADGSDQALALYQNLLEAVAAGVELSGIDMASGINAAVSSAAALAQQLGVSVALASKLMAGGYSGKAPVVFDPRDPRYDKGAASRASNFGFEYGSVSPFDPSRQPKVRGGGGGGGGGGGSAANPMDFIEQRLATAQAAADAARIEASAILLGADAATKERAKIDLLNEAKRRKLDLDQKSVKTGLTLRQEIDNQAAAIAKLTRETEIYRERAQFMDQQNEALKDGFLDAIVSGKDFGEVLKDVARNLAKAALEAALFNSGPFARPGSGGGGGLGGLFGKVLGGIFGGFRANGGPVNPGKSYVVGEQGPELFTPSRAGAIIPNGAAGGAGGKSVVMLSLSPDLEARILDQSANQSVMIASQAQRQQARAFPRTQQAMQARGTVG